MDLLDVVASDLDVTHTLTLRHMYAFLAVAK